MEVTVKTNFHPRDVIEAHELSDKERLEFDYYDWEAIERGEASPQFFRYKGQLYDLGEFTVFGFPYFNRPAEKWKLDWDGIQTDTFFSATVVKFVDGWERVIVGRVYA